MQFSLGTIYKFTYPIKWNILYSYYNTSLFWCVVLFLYSLFYKDVPGAPGTPEITGTDKKSVALKWTPPQTDGGAPVFNYVVQYRGAGSYNWLRANETTTVPDTTFSVTNLRENAEYEFRVSAENKAGVGPASPPTAPVRVIEPIGKLRLHQQLQLELLNQ